MNQPVLPSPSVVPELNFGRLAAQMPAMIAYWDRNLCNRFGNEAHRQWLGIDPSKMPGMHAREVMGEKRYRLNLPYMNAALQGKEQMYYRDIPTADGSHSLRALAQYVPDVVDGQVQGFYAVLTDVSYLRQAEEEQRIAAAAFETQQGMFITDANKIILRVNKAFMAITGYSVEESVGQLPSFLRSEKHDHAFYDVMWESIALTGAWQGEIWIKRNTGEVFPISIGINTVRDDEGLISHYVAAFSDVTSHKSAEEEIRSLVFTDALTGLPNRQHLIMLLQKALIANSQHQRHGALLAIDLDYFKTINNTYGREVGDSMLQQVAKRLSSCIRKGDTVSRVMGNEFVVLLDDLNADPVVAARDAKTVAGKVLWTLNQPYRINDLSHVSTASIGITIFDGRSDETSGNLLQQSELALRNAKACGRNTLCFFQPSMASDVSKRVDLAAGLNAAIEGNQLVLHYQPQATQDSSRYIGVEALLRWQHPRNGLIFPSEFIPLAEDTALIIPIGRWVLESACKQIALWASNPNMAHLMVAVNVSALQFHQEDFVEQVLTVLERTGANPERLKLELTESLLATNIDDVIAKMKTLKAHGIVFSLDDFGTGYSSLSYLKRLPLDQLKIDQSFVRNILIDPDDAAIARMVIALACSLGLEVIAEGVETQEQLVALAEMGCRNYQGYLFGRPLPVQELEVHVARMLA